MNNPKKSLGTCLMVLAFLACNVDENMKPGSPEQQKVSANFDIPSATLMENTSEGIMVQISLSDPVPSEGSITVMLHNPQNNDLFSLWPSPDDENKIHLPAEKGVTSVTFQVLPVNDGVIKGHSSLTFEIIQTTGSLMLGKDLNFELELLDDELSGKLKALETLGNWKAKKLFEYHPSGKIHKVFWETETPMKYSGVNLYKYDEWEKVVVIEEEPGGATVVFSYLDNKIIKSEKKVDEYLRSYTHYDYNSAGELIGQTMYERQLNGNLDISIHTVYTYHSSGNIHSIKQMVPDGPENWRLLTQFTFGEYIDKPNPVPYFDVLPNINI